MKIVYFSKGIRGSLCLQAVLEAGWQVAGVVGTAAEPDLVSLTNASNIGLLLPESINSPDFLSRLEELDPDLFILSGYNKILKSSHLSIPRLGTINLHGGKLPEYRGAAPINWQIINGETSGGCCILYVDEGIDTGDIITQQIYPITTVDTHASVLEKTLQIFPPLLLEVLEQIQSGAVKTEKQDPLAGRCYSRRYPRDSRINWQELTDVGVHNLVRGMHGPYPAAFTHRRETKVEIHQTRLIPETILGIPGRVPRKIGTGVLVLARNRGLVVEEITVDGQNITPADFFRIGDDLG